VKEQYLHVAHARAALAFAEEVATSAGKSLDLNRARYPKVIDEGTLARFETAKLEADRQVDKAMLTVRTAQLGLAYLLGVRSVVPDFGVDASMMAASTVPPALSAASESSLLAAAMQHRPDRAAVALLTERAEAQIALAKRLKFPDFVLSLQYQQIGNGQDAIQPPTLSFGITVPLPLFYSYAGEVKKGEAELALHSVEQQKVDAAIVAEVSTAWASFVSARKRVERMEGALLTSAQKARDITELQFNAGQVPLMDFLDAQRTYIATHVEYLDDLTDYWSAIFRLEQAVGTELRK
jgi:outer membrane protein, heavy metal efflux system